MAPPVKLPWELEEEILSRLQPRSLVRFRIVCKQWNALFNDKTFLNNHLSRSRPQFILLTDSKTYSIDIIDPNSIDPTIKLHKLPSSIIPYRSIYMYNTIITTCNEFLLCNYRNEKDETALWNPWSRHVKWIKNEDKQFTFLGVGYDNTRPKNVYKILGFLVVDLRGNERLAIYECASHALKFIDTPDKVWPLTLTAKRTNVSLNGNLYWVTCNDKTHDYFIRSFDFSMEIFKPFCLLPCQRNDQRDELGLAVYKGDRFSLLKQCYVTRKVEIWVTKKRITNSNGDDIKCC